MAKIKKLFQNESAVLQFTFLGTLRQFAIVSLSTNFLYLFFIVPDHDGGRPMEVNACILITHMVYL